MSDRATARLLEDGGEAAASDEFFRCREFLEAEGVTHSLVVESAEDEARLPLVVKEIPGSELRDAVSPYGYPGGTTSGKLLAASGIDWSGAGLVALFIRERIGSPSLAGGTERSIVQIADPARPRKSRPSDRQQIRRNESSGYELRSLPGPETTETDRRAFQAVYEETMQRTEASGHYFFSAEYFDLVLGSDRSWLFLCDAPGGEGVAAASIAVLSDGFLHYYLTGSADQHLREAPNKNLLGGMIDFAEELDVPLNLGGGLAPGDGLEEFKRGFANRQEPFTTLEVICDRAEYERLAGGRSATDFFPAYRAPAG